MLKEFKEFAMRGNVLDMAIGVILGGAFGKIVSSLVSDVLMPPIGLLMGHVDFSSLFLTLSGQPQPSLAAAKAAGAPTINYGVFLQTIVDFVIIAFVIFLDRQTGQSLEEFGCACRPSNHPRLSLLFERHSRQGDTLRALHL